MRVQCVRAVCARSARAQCHCVQLTAQIDICFELAASISRCTDLRSRADVPRFLENCLKLLVQLPDVTESVPSRRGGSTCGDTKTPGKHSVVLLPLFLLSVPLYLKLVLVCMV